MKKYYISTNKFNIQERMTKKGKVFDIFFYVTTLDGKYTHKRLSGFATKAKAKAAFLDFVQEECEVVRHNPAQRQKAAEQNKDDLTLSEYCRIYLASLESQNKESSVHDKEGIYRYTLLPMLGKEKPQDLTKERLYRWQDDLWNRKKRNGEAYAFRTKANAKKTLGVLLQFIEDRYGITNHLPEVKTPRNQEQKQEMQIWSREEFDRFLSVVDDPMYRTIFSMMFFTGRRKGEILALQAADVRENEIIFNKTYTRKTIDGSPYKITAMKNRNSGKTPICKPLREEIERYGGQSPFFFGGEKPVHENTLAHFFERCVEKSGVKRIRMHDLRHSFVSMLIHLGANFLVVADLIGDSPDQITKTYGHLYNEDKDSVIARIL